MTPPTWTRRLFPWILLRFINRHTKTCWPRMVDWKKYGPNGLLSSWWPQRSCWGGPGEGWDYCGRWEKREEFPA